MKHKKSFAIILIVFFIGLGAISGFSNTIADNISCRESNIEHFILNFSEPKTKENGEFINIIFEETNSFMTYETEPMMPFYSKTYEFPFGTKIIDVEVKTSKIETISIDKYIEPVPSKQRIADKIIMVDEILNKEIYVSSEPYPSEWFRHTKGAGLNLDNKHVLFLSLHIFPARYIPLKNSIEYARQINLSIIYEEPESEIKKSNSDNYALVIISPTEFSNNLIPLVSHKNNYGIKTKLITLEEIYDNFSGRDNAETIKYFVKHAIEKWNTNYVLLIGDIKKLPIRITYASFWEPDILSDLYYGDIYDSEYRFCSWDGNENNRFGEISGDFNNINNVDICI